MRQWTQEERQHQRELIRGWQPWKKNSGVKTVKGKEKSRMNALKHGGYTEEMRAFRRYLREARSVLDVLTRAVGAEERSDDPAQRGGAVAGAERPPVTIVSKQNYIAKHSENSDTSTKLRS